MKVHEFNTKKLFSEVSGTSALIDENIYIELNDLGLYEEKVLLEKNDDLNASIEFVSPYLNQNTNESDIANMYYSNIEGIQYDQRIGYYLSLYAGHVIEGNYRENASSGGMGTWIFKELFDNNLIDGVIHVKQTKNTDNSLLFHYDISRSIEEIKEGSKTKYYPVELSKVLKLVKQIPGRYAIIGIPSFIMAIRLLAEKDAIIKERIVFTVGLICGHQKSSKFAEALAWQVGIKPGDLINIDFRKKIPNRTSNNYGVEMTGLINGQMVNIVKPIEELLGQDWGQGFFKTLASDFTDDVMNETADITLGDAWLPEYIEDTNGNNIIIVRNSIIDNIIKKGIETNRLKLDKVDKETIFLSQISHYRHTHDELSYRLYKKDKSKEWRPKKRVEPSNDLDFLRRKVQDLREEISSLSHLEYKKAVDMNDLSYFYLRMDKLTKKYDNLYKLIHLKKIGLVGTLILILNKICKYFKK